MAKKKPSKRWKFHALLLQKERDFDGKKYYLLPKKLNMKYEEAEKIANKIRDKGGNARVLRGTFKGNPSPRIWFRYDPNEIIKRTKKKSKKKIRKRSYV